MKILTDMATSVPQDSPSFARLTGGRRASSWFIAIPATFLVVALVILMAWLAARASSRQQMLSSLQRDYAANQRTLELAQRQSQQLQAELETARDPGRTTVLLQAPAQPRGRGRQAAENGAWGTAVWGESQGKSWARISAYGLRPAPPGQALTAWFEPTQGAPVEMGKLDPTPSGTAFLLGKDLPAVDHGKRIFVSLEAESAKTPAGQVLFEGSLPKLEPLTKPAR